MEIRTRLVPGVAWISPKPPEEFGDFARGKSRIKDPTFRAKVFELKGSGMTNQRISERLRMHPDTVSKLLRGLI